MPHDAIPRFSLLTKQAGSMAATKLTISHKPRNLKILLIEDERTVATIFQFSLERFPELVESVEIASSMTEGLLALNDPGRSFDLILLDLNLPDSKPYDTLDTARKLKSIYPVIVLTGYPEHEFKALAMAHGAFDYVVKTVGSNESNIVFRLVDAIERAAERYATRSNKELIKRGSLIVREIGHQIEGYLNGWE